MKATLPCELISIKLTAPADAVSGAMLISDKLNITFSHEGICVKAVKGKHLKLETDGDGYKITYSILRLKVC